MLGPRSSRRDALGRSVFLAAAVALAACSGSSPETVRMLASATSETQIAGPNDVTVIVPAGALADDTVIVVQALAPSRRPANATPVVDGVRLGPNGLEFAQSVEVIVPVPAASIPPGKTIDDVVIMRAPQGSVAFVPLPTRRQAQAVAAVTEHFSDFVVVIRDAPDGSLDACGDAMCVGGETCDSCPIDCGLCLPADTCGNLLCESAETCTGCNYDCPICGPVRPSITIGATGLEWLNDIEPGTFTYDAAVAQCDALEMNGQTDWRLPTRSELVGIVDFARGDPAFDPAVFPTVAGSQIWSSSLLVTNPTVMGWTLFANGQFAPLDRSMSRTARCVRTDAVVTPRSFVDNANGTVTDQLSGLVWQKQDDAMLRDLAAADTYCTALPLGAFASGWRVPTTNELATLVDDDVGMPMIDSTLFPSTSAGYWTSTPSSNGSSRYMIDFIQGIVVNVGATATYRTRCVHDP